MPDWIDISVPIRPGMISYEGDPPVRIERLSEMASGAICNISRLDFGVHSGTHIDAPLHFIERAPGAEAIPLDALLGPVTVVDATDVTADIDAAALDRLRLPGKLVRVIFKTANSRLWALDDFSPDFIGLTEGAAHSLLQRGVRLVGIDYLSIAPRADPAPTHIALLAAGVVILEGLDLRAVQPGDYELACLPLLIPGSDGAPARALLRPLQATA
ncbi:MAG: cyclase family protein [Dehalococcoidia bacterium]